MDQTDIEKLIGELDVAVDRLRSLYEQYFMGIEKIEPMVARKDVERRVQVLRKEQIRNTALRFRFQMLLQRFNTYQTHWQRVCRDIENGTYKRHVARAQQRFGPRRSSLRPPAPGPTPSPVRTLADELAELDREFAPAEELGDSDIELDEAPMAARRSIPPRRPPTPPPAKAHSAGRTPSPRPPPPRSVPAPAIRPNQTPAAGVVPAPRRTPPVPAIRPNPTPVTGVVPAPRRTPPAPPPSARPAAPSPARPKPAPAARAEVPSRAGVTSGAAAPVAIAKAGPLPPDLAEERVRQLYSQYVETRRRQNESTASITYDAVAQSIRQSSAKLRQKLGRAVDFEVVVKDGRAILRPVVK